VDARDLRVGDERDRAVAGDELPQLLQRPEGDVDARCGQDDVVE